MLESFLKPEQSHEDDKCVDDDRVPNRRDPKQSELLPCIQIIDINGVKPALGSGASREKQSIDIC
jgi:hypothetical protein